MTTETMSDLRSCGIIEAAPEGDGTPLRGLTHSSDQSREGLAVDATHTCRGCGKEIARRPNWSEEIYAKRLYCDLDCKAQARPSVTRDYTITDIGCWEWLGYIDRNGYGKAYDPDMPKRSRVDWAHRVSYRRHRGHIPEGFELDHVCQNTRCINPDHLDAVTRAEHIRRTVERAGGFDRQLEAARLREMGLTYKEIADGLGMAARTSSHMAVKKAIENGLVDPDSLPSIHRLTEEQYEDIRDLYMLGIPQRELAAWYRIDSSQVSRIVNGKTSGHSQAGAT